MTIQPIGWTDGGPPDIIAANLEAQHAAAGAYADSLVLTEKNRAQAAEQALAGVSALNAEITRAENAEAALAPKANPTLTGTVVVPTAPVNTNSTVASSTAYSDRAATNSRAVRSGSVGSSATPTINTDNVDQFNITALAAAITSMSTNLSGSPVSGQRLMLRIKDNGTARAITWGASFVSSGVATLLATTVAGKTHMVGLIYDEVATKWVCAAVDATGY